MAELGTETVVEVPADVAVRMRCLEIAAEMKEGRSTAIEALASAERFYEFVTAKAKPNEDTHG